MSFSEWKKYRVGDIAKVKNGFAFKGKDFISSGVPVIKIKNVKPGKILLNDLSYVSREVADNARKYKINIGDILITMSGNRIDGSPDSWVGKVAMFREEGEYLLNQRVGIIEINSNKIDSIFLSYLLSSIQTQQHFITKANSSGGQANISPDVIHDTEFFAPDLPEQKQIASILRSIDDTIENNQQINKTLEEMAKAIFKEWFVNFNFPNATGKFQETEIGKIPVGWKVGKLGDVAEINPKLSLKKGSISKYVEMKDLSEDSSIIKNFREREFSSGSKFQNGDTLLARITPCLENGKTGLVSFLEENEIGWGSTEFIVLRGKGNVGSNFIYCLSRFEPFRNHAVKSMLGSSGRQRVVESMLIDFNLAIPPNELLIDFEKLVSPFFNQINNNEKENQSLINLRDTLLPKLMKGEIEINQSLAKV